MAVEVIATYLNEIADEKGRPFIPLYPEGKGWQLIAAVPYLKGVIWYWQRVSYDAP